MLSNTGISQIIQGNTAVYLIYSYVRVCSILRKAGLDQEKFNELIKKGYKFTHPHERLIATYLIKLPENLDAVTDDLMLHR